MKKYLFLILGALIFGAQKAFCEIGGASPELEKALKSHANEPSVMSIIFALVVVICLIYITGFIYSKLNIVGAKTIQKQFKNHDLNKVIVISTTQLGQGKNLHVIEINKKRYLVGATQTSINLIKELEAQDEVDVTEPKPTEKTAQEPMQILYGDEKVNPESKLNSIKDFDIHKKYL